MSGERGHELQRGLKQRHMTMIALGGIIGAGLFVGSSAVIDTVGPGAVVSYLAAGVLVILVMRMLGEMAVANPSVGSFADYTRSAIGGWAGFTTGWLFWYFWAIVLAIEAVAGAEILQRWIDAPTWLMSIVLMALLTLTNLWSVRSYGEFEFWFASIKVAAIIAFILIGAGWLFGLGSGDSPGLSNLTTGGGFAPDGAASLLSGIVVVIFAFVGAEIVTIAAAESEQPEEAVARSVRSVVYRVLVFYVLAVFLLVAVVPWTQVTPGESPFISALERIGIPGSADVMNAIIVTAVLSCLNSGLYTGSRMLFALARRGDAPKALLDVNDRGVPVKAILLTTSIGFLSAILAYLSPDTVFLFLVNSSGAIALFVYLLIAVAELRMRRQLEREAPERLKVRMWLYPWLTWASIVAIVAVVGSMAFVNDEATRAYLAPSLISLAIVVAVAFGRERLARPKRSPAQRRGSPAAARGG
jgi:GABA permease